MRMRWFRALVVTGLGLVVPRAASAQAPAQCAPLDSSVVCCLKMHPGQFARCGASVAETAADVAEAAEVAEQNWAISEDSIRSLVKKNIAVHLARLLKLPEVGGQPPGEPPSNRSDNHWWHEIKTWCARVNHALRRSSREQVIRDLTRGSNRLTEEQIRDIEQRLIEAAKKMGEEPPKFLPKE